MIVLRVLSNFQGQPDELKEDSRHCNGPIIQFQDIARTRTGGSVGRKKKEEEEATSGIPQVEAVGTVCRRSLNKCGELSIHFVATSLFHRPSFKSFYVVLISLAEE